MEEAGVVEGTKEAIRWLDAMDYTETLKEAKAQWQRHMRKRLDGEEEANEEEEKECNCLCGCEREIAYKALERTCIGCEEAQEKVAAGIGKRNYATSAHP